MHLISPLFIFWRPFAAVRYFEYTIKIFIVKNKIFLFSEKVINKPQGTDTKRMQG